VGQALPYSPVIFVKLFPLHKNYVFYFRTLIDVITLSTSLIYGIMHYCISLCLTFN
jgi:hypothetical protein